MTTVWLNAKTRAARVLAVRLLELETRLPADAHDGAGWREYLLTTIALALLSPPSDTIEVRSATSGAAGRYAGRAERFKGGRRPAAPTPAETAG
jgi:hypothetical protein